MVMNSKIMLRKKSLACAQKDYAWETDEELARLDASPVLTMSFTQYLADYTYELRHPPKTSRQFAVQTLEGKHIGNCSFYNINESRRETELGIMIGDRKYWNKGYGTDVVTTLVDYIFNQTDLNRVHLKTLETNIRAQKCFKKSGFTECGHMVKNGYSFMLMEIYRDQWQERQTET